MRTSIPWLVVASLLASSVVHGADVSPSFAASLDCSSFRGANYCAAGGHHVEHWLHYNPAETERDLDFARKVAINQVRVFLSYPAYKADPAAFRAHLIHLARACAERHIGLMPVVMNKREMIHEAAPYPATRAWIKTLVDAIGNEPALVCWDAYNEPDYPDDETRPTHTDEARLMASLCRELDTRRPRTPVTIGFAFEKYMEQNADAVDLLSFHDYSPTRDEIAGNIDTALAFAAKAGKPVVNSEIGCTARANPYDVTIEEYMRHRAGFYIWELMITSYWGDVHGIFYPDGTIRDPSIAAAMLGLFRNRGPNAVEESPDREHWVSKTVTQSEAWLEQPTGTAAEGLRLAEIAANLLEANELVAMREPPSRRVAQLRASASGRDEVATLLRELVDRLRPYRRPAGS